MSLATRDGKPDEAGIIHSWPTTDIQPQIWDDGSQQRQNNQGDLNPIQEKTEK